MKKTLPIAIAVIIVGIAAFFGGMKYGQSTNLQANAMRGNFQNGAPGMPQFTGQARQPGDFGQNFRGAQNNKNIIGEIIKIDDKSITVKISENGSKIILLADSTSIAKSIEASTSDLTEGTSVMVSGTPNSDGSVTATSIQINPLRPALPSQEKLTQQPAQQTTETAKQ